MPGRMPTQELDPTALETAPAVDQAPMSVAPPSVDALTAGGNGAMSRLMSGGGPDMSVDPLMSVADGGETAVAPTGPMTRARVPDLPPEDGTDEAGDLQSHGPAADGPQSGGSESGGPQSDGPQSGGSESGGAVADGPQAGGPGAAVDLVGPVQESVPADASPSGPEPVVPEPAIDPLLVDDELAEHERWGSATGAVGGAGSAERAAWVAETVGGAVNSSAVMAAGTGAALELGTRAAARLAVRRFPVPMIGAVLGGLMSVGGLISQFGSAEERAKVKATFDAYGTGTGYERAANNVDAFAAGLDIAGNILDVIGLVAGGIAIWGWAAAIPTLGASLAWAAPATAIATGVQVASGLLGAIKIALQSLVLVFRALHAFGSDADPRAVLASGEDLAGAAGNIGGVLGGFAGGAVAGKGADRAGLVSDPNRSGAREAADALAPAARVSQHPEGPTVEVTVRAGDGDAPTVAAQERTVLTAEEFAIADQLAANPNGTVLDMYGRPANGTPTPEGQPAVDLDEATLTKLLTGEVDDPDLARRIAHTVQDDPKDASTVRPRSILDPDPTPADLRTAIGGMAGTPTHRDMIMATIEEPGVAGVGYGHASYLVDANGNPLPASDATRDLGPHRGETGSVVIDPVTGEKSWDPTAELHLPGTGDHAPEGAFAVRVGDPGRWADHVFDGADREEALRAAIAYARARALAGAETIADDSALPRGWAPRNKGDQVARTQDIDAMNVYEINPATPRVLSTVAPQPEMFPGLDPKIYPGGGPQSEMPAGTIPWGSRPVASFAVQSGFMHRRLDGTLGTIGDANDAASLAALTSKGIDAAAGGGGGAAGGGVTPDQRRIEPVNPAYESPPGTPEQLAQMRREIGEMLVCRSRADADASAARADRAVTAYRADQVTSAAATVDTLGTNTADQQAAVADTTAANRQQQARQGEAGASLGTIANRATGFGTLEGLLIAWGTASRAGAAVVGVFSEDMAAKMVQMADDAGRFRGQLESMNGFLTGQTAQQPARADKLAGDSAALGTEAARTTATGASVRQSAQQVDAIAALNAADAAAAVDAESRAAKDATDAAVAAAQAQAEHDQLAADLMAWAARHREQRRAAVAATCERLRVDGYEVVGESFW